MVSRVRPIRQLQALIDRGLRLRYTSLSEALELGESALSQARELGCRESEAQALRLVAACLCDSEPEKGFELGAQATEIALETGDHATAAGGYLIQFVFLHDHGMEDRASEAAHAAYSEARQANDTGLQALALYNLGVSAESSEGYEHAWEYYRSAYDLCKGLREYPYRVVVASAYGRGFTHHHEGVTPLRHVLKSAQSVGTPADVLQAHALIADVHLAEGAATQAVSVALEGILSAREPCNGSLSPLYEVLARANLKLERPEKALAALDEGLAADHSDLSLLQLKARVLRQLGRNAQAFDTLEHYLHAKEEQGEKLQRIRIRYLETAHRVEMAVQEGRKEREEAERLERLQAELQKAQQQKEGLQKELFRLSSTDEITGSSSRKRIIEEGLLAVEKYRHMGAEFTVLLINVDHQKQINQEFGHVAGDEALRRVVLAMAKVLRETDSAGRLGSEGFCVILSDAGSSVGFTVGDRIRQQIAKIETDDFLDGRAITVSVGVCQIRGDHSTFFDVLTEAGKALFVAKQNGRNRVHLSTDLGGAGLAA